MKNITYKEYDEDIFTLAETIAKSGKSYKNLYPIPRGGYYPTIVLSKYLELPITNILVSKETLVVDDIVDSGKTLEGFKDYDTAVVYAKEQSKDKATYYGAIKKGWLTIPDEKDCDIEEHIRRLIEYIGENPNREGLLGTPDRIIRMWKEIFRGYDPSQKPKITTFSNDMKSTDIVFDTGDYYSMCEHHILPFFGKYYFAYIPKEDGKILGISKIARVVGYCSARLQLQEKLAREIVEMLSKALDDYHSGMAIVMKGQHLCKTMRGVKNKGAMTVAHLSGIFKEDCEARKEFYRLIEMQER